MILIIPANKHSAPEARRPRGHSYFQSFGDLLFVVLSVSQLVPGAVHGGLQRGDGLAEPCGHGGAEGTDVLHNAPQLGHDIPDQHQNTHKYLILEGHLQGGDVG